MSEAEENMDAATALGSSIHLNEDDWLQLLQKLTPSSIDNLQQTLKRIQQRESPTLSQEKLNFLATASQLCGSSLLSPTVSESHVLTSQNTPLMMSLGVSKAAVPSVLTVPSVLNVSKAMPTQLQNTIVLPSTALLIAPSGHGQPISLDSRVPASGVNRLLVSTGGLPLVSTGSTTVTASSSDTFNSLNTLASAAVAVAANASGQTAWSPDLLGTAKSTSSVDSVSLPTSSTATDSQPKFGSTAVTLPTRATLDSLLNSLCASPSTELSANLLSTNVGAAGGLTVYPIQVSANGPTVFIAAPKNQSTQGLSILGPNTFQLATGQTLVHSSFSNPRSFANSITTCCTTPISPNTFLSFNAAALNCSQAVTVSTPSPLSTSTPRTKPKFKALWENSLQGEGDQWSSVGNNSDSLSSAESNPTRPSSSTDLSTTSCVVVSMANPSTQMRPNSVATKRQSPMLGVKSIGQTPKRLAASAASLTDGQEAPSQDGPKKLLLVCSQPKQSTAQSTTDSGISIASAESLLTRVLHARTLAAGSTASPELSWNTISLTPTTTTDPKPHFISSQPLLAPANVVVSDLRPNPCSNTHNSLNTISFSDQEMPPSAIGSRAETMLSKSFEDNRRLLKEDSVGDDEARRRAKRRERNRVAAARCRQRRQDQIVELQHKVGALTKTGDELRSSLQTLELERTRLEGLIRQHGLAGCPEAEQLLSRIALERSDLATDDNLPTFTAKLDEMVRNSSSTPSVILVTNTLGTKPEPDCSEPAQNTIRPSLAKLDLRRPTQLTCAPNVVISAMTSASFPTKRGGETSRTEDLGTVNTSGTSHPSTISRLAARPSTLIPDKLLSEGTQLSDKLSGSDNSASVTSITTTTTMAGPSSETPTPGFWPSELQTFSPILTPSTWRLLKNLTSNTCSTPQSIILTPTFNSPCSTLSLASLASPIPTASTSSPSTTTTATTVNLFTPTVDVPDEPTTASTIATDTTVAATGTVSSQSTELLTPAPGKLETTISSVSSDSVVAPNGDGVSEHPSIASSQPMGQAYFLSFTTRCDKSEHGSVTSTTASN